MLATKLIWLDGKFTPWDEAKIHVLTHTLHYGGGAFEGIRCYKTEKGSAIFRLEEHVKRLFYSASVLHMSMPFTEDEICAAIIEVIRVNQLEEGYIRPIAFYGYGRIGINPIGAPINLAIACWPWGVYLPHNKLAVKTSRYIRIHPDSTIVDAKLCGHYLNGILATLEIQGTHFHEVLFLDEHRCISEGAGENFFLVKNNIIYTPPLGTILAGITRSTILTLAQQLNLTVQQKNLTLNEVYAADEAFFTGTAAEVTPIHSVDDHIISDGNVGPITQKIKQAYLDTVRGKNAALINLLTFV